MECELYTTGIIGVGTKDAFDGSIAAERIGTSVLILFIDTHHLKGKIANIHKIAYPALQFLCLFVTQHQHLAAFLHVNLIDETTLQQFYLVNLRVVGIYATNARTDVLLSKADACRRIILCSYFVNVLREFLFRNLHVTPVQTNVAPLL